MQQSWHVGWWQGTGGVSTRRSASVAQAHSPNFPATPHTNAEFRSSSDLADLQWASGLTTPQNTLKNVQKNIYCLFPPARLLGADIAFECRENGPIPDQKKHNTYQANQGYSEPNQG
jgi:hypothetical protein